jgi:hypothetical protein
MTRTASSWTYFYRHLLALFTAGRQHAGCNRPVHMRAEYLEPLAP